MLLINRVEISHRHRVRPPSLLLVVVLCCVFPPAVAPSTVPGVAVSVVVGVGPCDSALSLQMAFCLRALWRNLSFRPSPSSGRYLPHASAAMIAALKKCHEWQQHLYQPGELVMRHSSTIGEDSGLQFSSWV